MNEFEKGETRGKAQKMVPTLLPLKEMNQEEDPVDEIEEETLWCDVQIKVNWRHGRMIRRQWYHETSSGESFKGKA